MVESILWNMKHENLTEKPPDLTNILFWHVLTSCSRKIFGLTSAIDWDSQGVLMTILGREQIPQRYNCKSNNWQNKISVHMFWIYGFFDGVIDNSWTAPRIWIIVCLFLKPEGSATIFTLHACDSERLNPYGNNSWKFSL